MTLCLVTGISSDVGSYRHVNQDAAFAAPWGAGVADGVGGAPAGDVAAVALIRRLAARAQECRDADDLVMRVQEANHEIAHYVQQDPSREGMSTTLTGLWVDHAGGLLLAHTGDSRAYVLREGEFTRQTRDDSFVQALVDHGIVSEADAATHPRRNVITASLRGDALDRVTISEPVWQAGDRWLLCSDGVSDYVPHDLLAETVARAPDPQTAAERVVAVALEAATRDNATAVVCDLVDGSRDSRMGPPVFAGAAVVLGDLDGLASA
ncbi:PP2C family protein-serine/threonine phosphatase [Microbacterium sp.]|uniref:PP2C family protein-serine/threonine phosphatase n=1 Tax=Microbacterium sp. TaxID=51671 RepID=UPI003A8B36A0